MRTRDTENPAIDPEAIDSWQQDYLGVNIYSDIEPPNPRTDWDHLGTMVTWHRRYQLGDQQPSERPSDWYAENIKPGDVILPLHMYEHGGIALRVGPFSCPWDSGQLGYIYATAETIRKEYSAKRISKKLRQQVADNLRAEVEEYGQYLAGDVYYYAILGPTGATIDSCCGFYGLKYARQAAGEAAEYILKTYTAPAA